MDVSRNSGGNVKISSSCGDFTPSTSYGDITNLTVTIKTTGRPVFVGLIGVAGSVSYLAVQSLTAGGTAKAEFKIFRDAVEISENYLTKQGSAQPVSLFVPVSSINVIDVVPAGTYVYKIQMKRTTGDGAAANNAKLIAYEI